MTSLISYSGENSRDDIHIIVGSVQLLKPVKHNFTVMLIVNHDSNQATYLAMSEIQCPPYQRSFLNDKKCSSQFKSHVVRIPLDISQIVCVALSFTDLQHGSRFQNPDSLLVSSINHLNSKFNTSLRLWISKNDMPI